MKAALLHKELMRSKNHMFHINPLTSAEAASPVPLGECLRIITMASITITHF